MIERLTDNPIGSLVIRVVLLMLLVVKLFRLTTESIGLSVHSLINLNFTLNEWIIKYAILTTYLLGVFLLLRINLKHRFVESSTTQLWLFVITGFTLIPLEIMYLNVAVSMLLNIIALGILLKIHHQPHVRGLIFSSSLLISLGSILFYPFIIFLLLVIATLVIFRPFNLKNYILIIVGFLLPLFYLVSLNYLTESNWFGELPEFINESIGYLVFGQSSFLFWCFLLLAVLSLFKIVTSQGKFIVRQRKQLIVVYLFIVLTFVEGLMVHLGNLLFFLLLPIGLFYSYWHQFFKRKWILDTVLITLIITSFFIK